MKRSVRAGFSFGLTSGIITTLGLIVGLHSGTHSKPIIIGGIFIIAIADAFSDALGIHISQESENMHSTADIWRSTFATFIAKFIFALTFIIPVLLFSLDKAILVSILWGMLALGVASYKIAVRERAKPWKVVLEHLLIAVMVVAATHYVGDYIRGAFS